MSRTKAAPKKTNIAASAARAARAARAKRRRDKTDKGRGPGMTYMIILATDAQKRATKATAKKLGLSLSNYIRKRMGFPGVKPGRKVKAK